MFPQAKLALMAANLMRKHGNKLLHANNADLLTRDLGLAMKEQKSILSDARKGALMTGYDLVPVVIEVKLLTMLVARQLKIQTKGKSDIAVLDEIVAAADARNGGKYAKDIKATLEWTRALFTHPEIQDILKMDVTSIELPKSARQVLPFFMQVAGRTQDEFTRVTEFLKRAKDFDIMPEEPTVEPPVQKTPEAANDPVPAPEKPVKTPKGPKRG